MNPPLASKSRSEDTEHQNGLWCDIHDFDQLFLSHNDKEAEASPERGLPFGASMLLSGPPGSGKTTFALGLARSLMIRAKRAAAEEEEEEEAKDEVKKPHPPRFVLFYISPEVSRERLESNYREFGWFGDDQEMIDGIQAVWITPDDPERRSPTFHSITTYPEMDRPVPSPDDQVNHVFNRIAKTITPSEGETDGSVRYIVIVDSITALLKGCLAPGDERRQTHEILHRFTTAFGYNKLALILMTAEQDHTDDPALKHSLVEDYLAGIVIKLAHQPLPLGRTTRTLQILKSQGVHMVPGIHTWAIITGDRYEHHLRTTELRREVFENSILWKNDSPPDSAGLDGIMKQTAPLKWGTLVIFARPKLQHPDLVSPSSNELETSIPLFTGTPGLDEILTGDQEYWLRPEGARQKSNPTPALRRGKTTLLAGTVGTGTTRLCLQFLLHDALHAIKAGGDSTQIPPPQSVQEPALSPSASYGNEPQIVPNQETPAPAAGPTSPEIPTLGDSGQGKKSKVGSLLVLLNVKAGMVVDETFDEMVQLARKAMGMAPLQEGDSNNRRKYLRVLDFTQSNFEFNHLVSHLRWAIQEFEPDRIAFDGLSEYLVRSNSADAPGMLEAISALILHHPIYNEGKKSAERPAVMMTYELTMDGDPLAPESLGVSADNIIAVRQVALQDEIHKVVYVLKSGDRKAGDRRSDQNIRELVYKTETGMFEVRSGLDTFNGLLTGKEKKAEVLLQLFGENAPEQSFNKWLKERVTRLAKLNFTTLDFSRPAIGRTLEDTHSQTLFPPADLKLVSVDEWWLSYDRAPKTASGSSESEHELINLRRMWDDTEDLKLLAPSWQDYLYFELDKAGPIPQDGDESKMKYFAVPAHMDFGLFCVNVELLKNMKKWTDMTWPTEFVDPPPIPNLRGRLVETLPSVWTKRIATDMPDQFWFNNAKGTVCAIMKDWKAKGVPNTWAFSFDIATRENCVSFFLELTWAFGASEDCLSTQDGAVKEKNWVAMRNALLFLQYLVLEEFMPHRATVETSRSCLFSRHFYSTLQVALANDPEKNQIKASVTDKAFQTWPRIIAMPWFPGGVSESASPLDMRATARAREIGKRVTNLWNRCRDAGAEELSDIEKSPDWHWLQPARQKADPMNIPKTLDQVLLMTEKIRGAIMSIGREATNANGEDSPRRKATQTDLAIMMRQHLFRLKLFLSNAPKDVLGFVQSRDLLREEFAGAAPSQDHQTSVGFCCSGSWYYGVHRTSSSPSLARELLQEMTSLEASKEMARLGAGIPARGDFFEIHGDETVPGMPYISWNQLVTECGASVRRRGRVVQSSVKPARVHQTIHRQILDALQRAYLLHKNYEPRGSASRRTVIKRINVDTEIAVGRIWASAGLNNRATPIN